MFVMNYKDCTSVFIVVKSFSLSNCLLEVQNYADFWLTSDWKFKV